STRLQRGSGQKRVESFESEPILYRRRHRIDGNARGHLTGGMATHAIGHHEQSEPRIDGPGVLVVGAPVAHVGGASELHRVVTPREVPGHVPRPAYATRPR